MPGGVEREVLPQGPVGPQPGPGPGTLLPGGGGPRRERLAEEAHLAEAPAGADPEIGGVQGRETGGIARVGAAPIGPQHLGAGRASLPGGGEAALAPVLRLQELAVGDR